MTTNNCDDSFDLTLDQDLIAQLELAIRDLLWQSEAEYPFQSFYWKSATNFKPSTLLQQGNFPPGTKIELRAFSSFFDSVTTMESWHNEEEQAEVERFQHLIQLMNENLADPQVYLIGEVEITAYILGQTRNQAIAGISTKIVST